MKQHICFCMMGYASKMVTKFFVRCFIFHYIMSSLSFVLKHLYVGFRVEPKIPLILFLKLGKFACPSCKVIYIVTCKTEIVKIIARQFIHYK